MDITAYSIYLPLGATLQGGKFRIVRFIGSGGFGCTYEAEHVLLGRHVAIKEFFMKDYCNRDEATAYITVGTIGNKAKVEKCRRKFIEEAKALAQVEHPHIVRVIDVFEENGTAYFVMDYIAGDSLAGIVKREGALSEARALKYILQVADALKCVHAHNRLHLDIKPGNIMVDNHDEAVLIDFGASKQYDEENGENNSTLIGHTEGYAPIEQYGYNIMKFMPATDIYALGATFYKLLSGVTPPPSNQLAGDVELDPLPPSISKSTTDAVYAAMQVKRAHRPQSIDEFLSILDVPTFSPQTNQNPIKDTNINVGDETVMDNRPKATPQPQEHSVSQPRPNQPSQQLSTPTSTSGQSENSRFGEDAKTYFRAAERGDPVAQNKLGECYYYGRGVQKDYNLAVKWFLPSADQGNDEAQNNLGDCFLNGKGVAENKEEAVKLFRLSAVQGNANARNQLGRCYLNGWGVAIDALEAVNLFRLSAVQGNLYAQYNLGDCYLNGWGIAVGKSEAVRWFRLSAEQGYADAQYKLGTCYLRGWGVAMNRPEAVKWYRLAAERGNVDAQLYLGNYYHFDIYGSKDYAEAVKWFRLAAEQGNAEAQYKLGGCYTSGKGVPEDQEEAAKWYRLAAEQGNKDAQCILGIAYLFGEGVAEDRSEAAKWLRLAAEQGDKMAKKFLRKWRL